MQKQKEVSANLTPSNALADIVIQSCLELLREHDIQQAITAPPANTKQSSPQQAINESMALLSDFKQNNKQEPIRVFQHFACTGGTIISKCLSVMPNTLLMSELNPLTSIHIKQGVPQFAPTDVIRNLKKSIYACSDELIMDIFKSELSVIQNACLKHGQYLVIRDHTHSDYCMGEYNSDKRKWYDIIADESPVLSAISVRDPVDSYLSIVNNRWNKHLTPSTFEEYCRRYLIFINNTADIPRLKYEDFIESPAKLMKSLCKILDIPFNKDFIKLISISALTGDSGRKSDQIIARPRREISEEMHQEISQSPSYIKLCKLLKYPIIRKAPH